MIVLRVFWAYVKVSFLSFGGILSSWSLVGAMMKECAEQSALTPCLVSKTAFAFSLSFSNLLPGPKVSGLSIVSYPAAGIPGMLATVAGLAMPGLIVIPVIRHIRMRWRASGRIDAFLDGARLATIAILLLFFLELFKNGLEGGHYGVFAAIVAAGVWLNLQYGVNAVLVILLSGIAGYRFLG
jgi:chromate transport protein ChrA